MDEALAYAPRATLLGLIAEQREQLTVLQAQLGASQAQVATLAARVAELEQRDPPAWAKANRPKPEQPRPPRKKRQQNFSRRREEPTTVVEHVVEQCPDCGTALAGGWVRWRRQVIDLPVAPATVTEHRVLARTCPSCRTTVTALLDLSAEVLGRHRVSRRVMALIALLREQVRLPLGLLERYLETVHGLHLSQGELVSVLQTVGQRAERAVTAIREAIRQSPVVHADETGWRQNGQNAYLWSASTPLLRYFLFGSRQKSMVDAILGEDFTGTLGTDFYAAYDHYPGPHQRCWAHLLRDIHELRRRHPTDVRLSRWGRFVHRLSQSAVRWPGPAPGLSAAAQETARRERQQAYEQVLARHCQPFVGQPVPQRVLCERVLKYLPELFTFLADPRVPATNNAAERSIRPVVVRRKISGGTRTAAGTLCRTALWTLTDTWHLQGKSPLTRWLELLAQPATSPV
jgi:transposase